MRLIRVALCAAALLCGASISYAQDESDPGTDAFNQVDYGAAFAAWQARAAYPLLPPRVVLDRNRSGAYLSMLFVSAGLFGTFLFLTYYLQQTLGYSALRAGTAYLAIALTTIFTAGLAAQLVTRLGVRPILTAGMAIATIGLLYFTQVDVHGHYLSDLLPSFLLIGLGLGVSFVAVTIAALQGVGPTDAGVASGLVNTSRQIGGAIGLAAISTIAASATAGYAHSHGLAVTSPAATVQGFQTAFVVLGGLLVAAFVVAGVFLRPARERVEEVEPVELQEAA